MKSSMSMSGFIAICAALSIASAARAIAGDKDENGNGSGPGPGVVRLIQWEELRERCANPGKFTDIQKEPANLVVQCSDKSIEFVQDSSGLLPLQGSRSVVTTVISDKFKVGAGEARAVPVTGKALSCPRLRELETTYAIERPINCNQLLNMKGTIEDFCVQQLDHDKHSNPKSIQTRETGRVIDLCAGLGSSGDTGSGGQK